MLNGFKKTYFKQIGLQCLFFVSFCFYSSGLFANNSMPVSQFTCAKKTSSAMGQFIYFVWHTNPGLQSAMAEIVTANDNFSQSKRPIYNPSMNLNAQHVNNDPLVDTYTAGISQTVDLFNKRDAQATQSQYGVLEAKANLAAQQLSLATQALKALADYRTAQAVVRLAKRRTSLLRQFQAQTMLKFKAGDIARDAVDQAALAYAEAISQQANEQIVLIQAQQQLIAITQMNIHSWPQLPAQLPQPLHVSLLQKQTWLQALPIIAVYNAKVAIATAYVRVTQTETKADPTISFQGGTEDNSLLVAGNISMPLFVRNNYQDRVQAAVHQTIAIEQARLNFYRQAVASLDSGLSSYQILYDATVQWQEASKNSLNGGMNLLNRLWGAGELSTTDYIIQLKQRIDSQIAGEELKNNAWHSWFSIMASSGQLKVWLAQT